MAFLHFLFFIFSSQFFFSRSKANKRLFVVKLLQLAFTCGLPFFNFTSLLHSVRSGDENCMVATFKMADEEVLVTTGASEDNVCISLWGVNSGILLKSYKGGSCPSRSVCLLGKDFILASLVNKSVVHVWHTAKVSTSEVYGSFRSTLF